MTSEWANELVLMSYGGFQDDGQILFVCNAPFENAAQLCDDLSHCFTRLPSKKHANNSRRYIYKFFIIPLDLEIKVIQAENEFGLITK